MMTLWVILLLYKRIINGLGKAKNILFTVFQLIVKVQFRTSQKCTHNIFKIESVLDVETRSNGTWWSILYHGPAVCKKKKTEYGHYNLCCLWRNRTNIAFFSMLKLRGKVTLLFVFRRLRTKVVICNINNATCSEIDAGERYKDGDMEVTNHGRRVLACHLNEWSVGRMRKKKGLFIYVGI